MTARLLQKAEIDYHIILSIVRSLIALKEKLLLAWLDWESAFFSPGHSKSQLSPKMTIVNTGLGAKRILFSSAWYE